MKAFVLVGLIFSAFLIILGITSIEKSGDVLAYAAIVAGSLVLLFVASIWTISRFKDNQDKKNDF